MQNNSCTANINDQVLVGDRNILDLITNHQTLKLILLGINTLQAQHTVNS